MDASADLKELIYGSDRPSIPVERRFKAAVEAANHWFGGNLQALHTAIGQPTHAAPEYLSVMPLDRRTFVSNLHEAIGSAHKAVNIAEAGLWYLQLCEILTRPPTITEFGFDKIVKLSDELQLATNDSWQYFVDTLALALTQSQKGR
ncbi:MAG: hypothetical protein M3Y56_03455 [Armatimonadota bacterium]|nr:hypothetical protein [Armatimonadota bacterium]